jgi:hypothetical protein
LVLAVLVGIVEHKTIMVIHQKLLSVLLCYLLQQQAAEVAATTGTQLVLVCLADVEVVVQAFHRHTNMVAYRLLDFLLAVTAAEPQVVVAVVEAVAQPQVQVQQQQ